MSKPITVSKHLSSWLLLRSASLAPRTAESYASLIRLHIAPAIGSRKLEKLRPKHVQQLLADLCGEGHTRTAELCFVLFRAALKKSSAAGVMENVERPLHRKSPPAWWSEAELRAYLDASSDRWRIAWLLALCCGLRRGELAGLRWCDVDLQTGLLRIRNQRQKIPGAGVIDTPPKSTAGIRNIPLPELLIRELSALHLVHEAHQLIGCEASPYVLQGRIRGGVSPSTIDHAHRIQLRKSGVRPIPLHGMRHTMATLAITTGVNTRVLQSLLGHADISTTAGTYAHVVTSAQRTAIDSVTHLVIK